MGSKIDGLSGPEPAFFIVGHKSRCSELISGTKALPFVTFPENTGDHRSKGTDHLYRVHILWSEWSRTKIFHCTTLVIFNVEWLVCNISKEVRSHRSNVIWQLCVVTRPETHSFPTAYSIAFDGTCNNQNSHKLRCSKLISGTKVLQFVTFAGQGLWALLLVNCFVEGVFNEAAWRKIYFSRCFLRILAWNQS